ncbi:MAG: twin-arginine translocase TatA/TatE family subunit [Flavobacteriales bacterium]
MLLFLNISFGEIFLIFLVILLFFGSKNIPKFARTFGKGIREFRNASNDLKRDITSSVNKVKDDMDIDKGSDKH